MSDNGSTGAFVFGLIVGAVAGAAATWLTAPRSGDDLRRDISSRSNQMQQRVRDTTTMLRDRSQALVDQYVGGTEESVVVIEGEPAAPVVVVEETATTSATARVEPVAGDAVAAAEAARERGEPIADAAQRAAEATAETPQERAAEITQNSEAVKDAARKADGEREPPA